ncbi:hypothetical protein DFH08DRAFT_900066 [Mycena albidolilacea]|uniref:Malate dehydrogenase n=1 Tax=Mycena albidolilacea TaxID=1033008 RepID=A0AAD7EBC9_9AGAR|nr:hypothetical protein DFH08DRAFT_900066 [Mycena albidolilacea]
MFSFQLLSTLASTALLVSAAPSLPKAAGCDTSAATLSLPANQTQLVAPTTAPLFVALGVGVQNYTCTAATLKYASVGAVASIFDISCIDKTPAFATIQTTAFNAWSAAPAGVSPDTVGGKIGAATLLGYHYFVPAPSGTGLSPKWDFTSTGKFAGNSTAFILAAKAGDILAPTDSATNVDWLALNNVQGSLASKVFRVDTVNGQPPTSCVAGSADISVKYTAKYYLY